MLRPKICRKRECCKIMSGVDSVLEESENRFRVEHAESYASGDGMT